MSSNNNFVLLVFISLAEWAYLKKKKRIARFAFSVAHFLNKGILLGTAF